VRLLGRSSKSALRLLLAKSASRALRWDNEDDIVFKFLSLGL
jgi:hypothetical protein